MRRSQLRTRYLWPGVLLLGVFAYLYALDGLYIPHIGDEAPYIEIARLTAESGRWLPLRAAPGLENTKPPLLFWLGIAATSGGETWSLFRLRLPVVVATFLTAAVVFWVSRTWTGDREKAWLGALTFLGFYSSFHYGRPFLTNLPETLFVFLAFVLFLGGRLPTPLRWVLIGLALGGACLVKSFALVVPVGLALGWTLLMERGWKLGAFLKRDAPKVLAAALVAIGCFALWPLLDPDPASVVRSFVLEENVGKLEGSDYFSGLFEPTYGLHRIWLGHLGNAGLFVLPLVYLVVVSVRERKSLDRTEKALWILVLSFLIVYSLPRQRQENYLIPTVPALAVLLGGRWKNIPTYWFRLFNVPAVLFMVALLSVMLAIRKTVLPPGSYHGWQLAVPAVVLALWSLFTLFPRGDRYGFHALVFGSFLSIGCAAAPFDGPAGRFDRERIARLRNRTVHVPTEFISRHERHRFLLPQSRIQGYDPADADGLSRFLDSGKIVVVHRRPGEPIEGPFRVLARRYDLRTRQTLEEMWRIVFAGELDLLVRQELVVRRYHRDRLIGEP